MVGVCIQKESGAVAVMNAGKRKSAQKYVSRINIDECMSLDKS